MHIPDGLLDPKTTITTGIISAAALGASFRYLANFAKEKIKLVRLKLATPQGNISDSFSLDIKKPLKDKFVKMTQIFSFVFILQMLDFTIIDGITGHFLGGALAAIILGPFEAIITISLVLILQAFWLADGGILALGANIFNMAVIGAGLSFYIYKYLRLRFNNIIAITTTSWFSVILAATSTSLTVSLFRSVPISTEIIKIHIIIGIAETIITLAIIYLFYSNILKKPIIQNS